MIGGSFYLLLIDTASAPELYALAGVALACGVAFVLSREQGFVEARVNPLWLARAWGLVWRIPLDIGIVCSEAVVQLFAPRPARGRLRAVRYRAVGPTSSQMARRALTEGFGSLAPNTIVVGVDAERGLLLVHQLRTQGAPEDLDVLRLG